MTPRTLTDSEVTLLLRTSFAHTQGLRDHVIFTLALKTGLREHELLALNIGDVYDADGRPKSWVQLSVYKRSNGNTASQQVALNDDCRVRLEKFYKAKIAAGQDIHATAPLFVSRKQGRLQTRQLRHLFHVWQERAGLERHFSFHALRHTACTRLYAKTKDIRLVQKFARHKNIVTTSIYTHASDTDLAKAVQFI